MSGVKGKSGRKKVPDKVIQEYLEANQERIPELLEGLTNKALDKIRIKCPDCGRDIEIPHVSDKDAAIYIIDRHLGRPKQQVDTKVTGQFTITPDMRALAARELIEVKTEETRLLEEG